MFLFGIPPLFFVNINTESTPNWHVIGLNAEYSNPAAEYALQKNNTVIKCVSGLCYGPRRKRYVTLSMPNRYVLPVLSSIILVLTGIKFAPIFILPLIVK
jgi:hypothetical protein